MSWAKFDDRYDDSRKVKRAWKANPAAVGLHVMAITYCARHELDGHVDIEWLQEKLPTAKAREAVLATLVECGLFEQAGRDYLVHDYLKHNPSRAHLETKRRADAERKARGRQTQSERSPNGLHADSERTGSGLRAESERRGNGPIPSHPIPASFRDNEVADVEEEGAPASARPGLRGRAA